MARQAAPTRSADKAPDGQPAFVPVRAGPARSVVANRPPPHLSPWKSTWARPPDAAGLPNAPGLSAIRRDDSYVIVNTGLQRRAADRLAEQLTDLLTHKSTEAP